MASKLFIFWLPKENVLGILPKKPHEKLISPAVSDGYWIMLKPLSPGKHTIYIYGKAEHALPDGSDFVTEMAYHLNVIPKSQMKP